MTSIVLCLCSPGMETGGRAGGSGQPKLVFPTGRAGHGSRTLTRMTRRCGSTGQFWQEFDTYGSKRVTILDVKIEPNSLYNFQNCNKLAKQSQVKSMDHVDTLLRSPCDIRLVTAVPRGTYMNISNFRFFAFFKRNLIFQISP